MATAKDHKDVALAELRTAVGNHQIIIHPRCVKLQSHLKFGIWDANRKKFARVDGFGHFDLIDALVYLYRNVSKRKNPMRPVGQGLDRHTHHVTTVDNTLDDGARELKAAFAPRKRRSVGR